MKRIKAAIAFMPCLLTANAYAIELVNRPYSGHQTSPITSYVQAQPIPVPSPIQKTWSLQLKDVNYYGAFQRWATEAGYQVRWDAEKHFIVEAIDTFTGSFEDAVTGVLANPAVAFSKYPLEVCFYPNTPPLARITRKGVQEKECQ
ncbi:hypothetical protein DZC30_20445 [Comamonas testosteroni]|uniref:Toxin co-regulated pilus biosynthesis protein Q C-terminal domain-containing protein n=1 Tax=Comamonas testosteroni TaxID=285 RepID=A0A373FAD5_COMTE|nr:TcpQ domain-containing protein [Comamonas testosteroni]RGE40435.1 hypothetical protein DZC30_20445 [Comamonas testosteroni]